MYVSRFFNDMKIPLGFVDYSESTWVIITCKIPNQECHTTEQHEKIKIKKKIKYNFAGEHGEWDFLFRLLP